MVVDCHHVACVCGENPNLSKKKKNIYIFFEDWDLLFKIGKESPKFHWEWGRNSVPENTQKNPCNMPAAFIKMHSRLLLSYHLNKQTEP